MFTPFQAPNRAIVHSIAVVIVSATAGSFRSFVHQPPNPSLNLSPNGISSVVVQHGHAVGSRLARTFGFMGQGQT
jgi:hypothetical protein